MTLLAATLKQVKNEALGKKRNDLQADTLVDKWLTL